jgi:aminoglycoside 3-N-acetyltransferase I
MSLNSRDDVVLSKNRLDTPPNVSSSNPFILRQLTSNDLPLMEAMLTMFGEAFDDVETYGAARPDAAYLTRLLGRDHFVALAALKDISVVGGLAAYELEKFEQARKEVYIYDLAVAASHWR